MFPNHHILARAHLQKYGSRPPGQNRTEAMAHQHIYVNMPGKYQQAREIEQESMNLMQILGTEVTNGSLLWLRPS